MPSSMPWDSWEEEKVRRTELFNMGRYGYACPSDAYNVRYWWEQGRAHSGRFDFPEIHDPVLPLDIVKLNKKLFP